MVREEIPKLHVDSVELVIINLRELDEIVESRLNLFLNRHCELILLSTDNFFSLGKVVLEELSDQ
jgi:hypothetical protein